MRARAGSVVKRKGRGDGATATWWARVTYTDPVTGKRHDRQRRAGSKIHAKELVHQLLAEVDKTGGRSLAKEHMTFLDLATYFEREYLKPAEYIEGRKVAGVRSISPAMAAVKALKDHFGRRQLRGITHSDIREFRAERLATKTKAKKQRSVAAVNRELEKLRRLLNIAEREGWILRNPMRSGDSLISVADERKRERILTREEELRLLAACDNRYQKHLRPILICALDTGMRRGEIFGLTWGDVDFEERVLTIRAFNTKTMKERQVSLTTRLVIEMEKLWEASPKIKDELVFGFTNNVKKSFTSVRSKAGLSDLRFHDLRHTAATRLVAAHLPLPEVGRVLGHTQANTTYRYVNANIETTRRAAAALDAFNTDGLEKLAAPKAMESPELVLDATEAVN
ncbi:MAG TPA: site-specific integrase [Pyrinomonadaceae bacterium]|nr:site-specific integrase [Pyrinomonadaceae bacterium]